MFQPRTVRLLMLQMRPWKPCSIYWSLL